jgi:hypothetical protein
VVVAVGRKRTCNIPRAFSRLAPIPVLDQKLAEDGATTSLTSDVADLQRIIQGNTTDILLQNTSGQTSIWEMSGNTITAVERSAPIQGQAGMRSA